MRDIDIMSQIKYQEEELDKLTEELKKLTADILRRNEPLYFVDFLCVSILNRTFSNIAAFKLLFKVENFLAFSAIIRLQFDSLLRLFAIRICKDKQNLAYKIVFSDKRLNQINWKLESGKKHNLTDTFLCEQFDIIEGTSWAKKVYQQASRFVHPSGNHFFSMVQERKDTPEKFLEVSMRIPTNGKLIPSQKDYLEAICCFNHITALICKYLISWAATKKYLSQTNRAKVME